MARTLLGTSDLVTEPNRHGHQLYLCNTVLTAAKWLRARPVKMSPDFSPMKNFSTYYFVYFRKSVSMADCDIYTSFINNACSWPGTDRRKISGSFGGDLH